MEKTVTLPAYPGASWVVTWQKKSYFCPNCGKQEVWEDDRDDYEVGYTYVCTACSHKFYLPGLEELRSDDIRIAALTEEV